MSSHNYGWANTAGHRIFLSEALLCYNMAKRQPLWPANVQAMFWGCLIVLKQRRDPVWAAEGRNPPAR